jgi:hypothetical protein
MRGDAGLSDGVVTGFTRKHLRLPSSVGFADTVETAREPCSRDAVRQRFGEPPISTPREKGRQDLITP